MRKLLGILLFVVSFAVNAEWMPVPFDEIDISVYNMCYSDEMYTRCTDTEFLLNQSPNKQRFCYDPVMGNVVDCRYYLEETEA